MMDQQETPVAVQAHCQINKKSKHLKGARVLRSYSRWSLLNLCERGYLPMVLVHGGIRAVERGDLIGGHHRHPGLPEQHRPVANAGTHLEDGRELGQRFQSAAVGGCKRVQVARPLPCDLAKRLQGMYALCAL